MCGMCSPGSGSLCTFKPYAFKNYTELVEEVANFKVNKTQSELRCGRIGNWNIKAVESLESVFHDSWEWTPPFNATIGGVASIPHSDLSSQAIAANFRPFFFCPFAAPCFVRVGVFAGWDTSSVTTFSSTFSYGSNLFNQDIGGASLSTYASPSPQQLAVCCVGVRVTPLYPARK